MSVLSRSRRRAGDMFSRPITHSQVLPISDVPIDVDVLLSRVRVDKDHRHFLSKSGVGCADEVKVVEPPADARPVLLSLGLDGLERGDEVREVVGSGSPALSEDAVDAT